MDYSYFAPHAQPYQFFGIAPAKPELSYTPQEEPHNDPLVSTKRLLLAHSHIIECQTDCVSLIGHL